MAVMFDLRKQRREINGVNRWLHINFLDTFSNEYNLSDAQSKIATREADGSQATAGVIKISPLKRT